MTEKKQYKSVTEMLRDVSPSTEIADAVEERISQRAIIKKLLALRAARKLSQKDVANKMGCMQSRISKLENGIDDDIRLGDFAWYCDALDMQCGMIVASKDKPVAAQVKYHVSSIKHILNEMVVMAGGDEVMEKGVLKFMGGVLKQIVEFVDDAVSKLPAVKRETANLHIKTIKSTFFDQSDEAEANESDVTPCCH